MMSVKVVLSVDDCHWIAPVEPVSVIFVLFVPEQTLVLPEIVPSTVAGLTVIVAIALLAGAHPPLVTTAR